MPRTAALSPSVVELPGPFEHELIHTRGVRLHAAVAGDPANPLVVLLHGSFGGWFDYREVIGPLAAAGFHVAAVDSRGYGLSDKPPATAEDGLLTATGDISGLIQTLGHDKAAVIGSDTGGTVAWALATLNPERVSALVSISSAHPTDLRRAFIKRPWNFTWLIARTVVSRLPAPMLLRVPFIARVYRRQLALNTSAEFQNSPAFDENLSLRHRASRIGHTHPAIVRNNRLLASSVPARAIDAKVTVPTLLLQPEQRTWRHLGSRSRRRVSSLSVRPARAEITTIPGTKNLPHLEDPEGFIAAVQDFLFRHL